MLTACAVVEDPDPAPDPWPCESTRGDARTTYEYDELHNITFWERFEAGVARAQELSRYAGNTLMHQEHVGGEGSYPLDRQLVGSRVIAETFDAGLFWLDYRETWNYEGGALTSRDRTWGDGHTSSIEIVHPDAATEITYALDRSRCTKRTTTRGDGWINVIEDERCDFTPETQWNHVLDATGRPLRVETWQLPQEILVEPVLMRRVTTERLDNGAPLSERDEVFGEGGGVVETVYRFACEL